MQQATKAWSLVFLLLLQSATYFFSLGVAQVWDDAITDGCQPDCRMATTLIEVCTRKGDTSKALATYQLMKEAGPGSSMVPSVHAYTAAMRAAAEGGAWDKALDIWSDMEQRNCKPTGEHHLYYCNCGFHYCNCGLHNVISMKPGASAQAAYCHGNSINRMHSLHVVVCIQLCSSRWHSVVRFTCCSFMTYSRLPVGESTAESKIQLKEQFHSFNGLA